MFSRLPIPFWFGCVLLTCVLVAIVSNAIGYQTAAAQQTSDPTAIATEEQKPQCCHECCQKDGLISRLRQELLEVRKEILANRQKRIEDRLADFEEQPKDPQPEVAVSSAEAEHTTNQSNKAKPYCKNCHRPRRLFGGG